MPSIEPEQMAKALHVAVAVIVRDNKILISKRAKHVDQGDLWEFPGGKVEPGEHVVEALQRELHEELGIIPTRWRPLIKIPYQYPNYSVLLDVWRVDDFDGEAHGREGQPLRWIASEALQDYDFPAANHPVMTAAQLPDRCLITPEPVDQLMFLKHLDVLLQQGIGLIQLRAKRLSTQAYMDLAEKVLQMARPYEAKIILNGHWQLLDELPGAHGIHLPSQYLNQLDIRPVVANKLFSLACHDEKQLQQASRLKVDFALLSPVNPTASHPEAKPLGWQKFRELANTCQFPIYALGGMGLNDLDKSHTMGAQGIAAIRALWGTS